MKKYIKHRDITYHTYPEKVEKIYYGYICECDFILSNYFGNYELRDYIHYCPVCGVKLNKEDMEDL